MKYLYTQNREISWLSFNERVLEEASLKKTPLLERLKFFSIFNSNLDEFYMVRVGSLSNILKYEDKHDSKTGMTISEQLKEVKKKTHELVLKKDMVFSDIISDLRGNGIDVVLDIDDKETKSFFKDNILDRLSPTLVDFSHPFPNLVNKGIYLVVEISIKGNSYAGIVLMPSTVELVYKINGKYYFTEQLIYTYADLIFKKYKVLSKSLICVTRNADITLDDMDSEADYKDMMKGLLKKRNRLSAVRCEVYNSLSDGVKNLILHKLKLDGDSIFITKSLISHSAVFKIIADVNAPSLMYKPYSFNENRYLNIENKIIPQVLKNDTLLFYPFEAMKPFLMLIKEAAYDKATVSINITIYRLSKTSKLIDYLIQASENGIEVNVLIELRARFDEQNNIDFSERLYEAGVNIMYGFEDYKVHSKLCLITRRYKDKLQYITQIGTGNYNEKTATLYTDYSYITARNEIGLDARRFFSNMLMGNIDDDYKHLLVSPNTLKSKLEVLIDEEIKKGSEGYLLFKMNSITDIDLINKLVLASQAGVKIDLIIRGICCILPGVEGYTENISVRSIVGRFLEHSRVYIFGRTSPKVYISSADFMTRNTTRRVEVATPILDENIKQDIIDAMNVILLDNVNARILNNSGMYEKADDSEVLIDSQGMFIEGVKKRERIVRKNNRAILTRALRGIDGLVVNPVVEINSTIKKKLDYCVGRRYVYYLKCNDKLSSNKIEKLMLLSRLLADGGNSLCVVLDEMKAEYSDVLKRLSIKHFSSGDIDGICRYLCDDLEI